MYLRVHRYSDVLLDYMRMVYLKHFTFGNLSFSPMVQMTILKISEITKCD